MSGGVVVVPLVAQALHDRAEVVGIVGRVAFHPTGRDRGTEADQAAGPEDPQDDRLTEGYGVDRESHSRRHTERAAHECDADERRAGHTLACAHILRMTSDRSLIRQSHESSRKRVAVSRSMPRGSRESAWSRWSG